MSDWYSNDIHAVTTVLMKIPLNVPAYTEAAFQNSIANVLDERLRGYEVKRELVLGPQDRPDFGIKMRDGRWLAIEAKIKGAATAIERQLARYAEHPTVGALVLVTTRSQHMVVGDNDMMNGKALVVVHVPVALG